MPAYNAGKFIRESINSVLSQSFEALELVVVDDGSTDQTCSLVPVSDPRVRLVSQKNGGPSNARNTGLRETTGEFVWYLDADDLLMPGAIATAVDALSDAPSLAGVVGRWSLIDESGNQTSGPRSLWPAGVSGKKHLFGPMLQRTIFPPSAALFRRQAIQQVNGWDENIWCAEDRDLWLRLLSAGGQFLFTDREWMQYREHNSNATLNIERIKLHTELYVRKWFGLDGLAGKEFSHLGPYVTSLACLYMARQCENSAQSHMAEEFVDTALASLQDATIDTDAVSGVLWEVAGSAREARFIRALWPHAGNAVADFCWANFSVAIRNGQFFSAVKRLGELVVNRPTYPLAKTIGRLNKWKALRRGK